MHAADVIVLLWQDAPYRMRVLIDAPTGARSYQVGADEALTDRFHRVYVVRAYADGRPKDCSCPDCQHRSNWCRHLRMVEQWWRTNTEAGREAQRLLEAQAAALGLERN